MKRCCKADSSRAGSMNAQLTPSNASDRIKESIQSEDRAFGKEEAMNTLTGRMDAMLIFRPVRVNFSRNTTHGSGWMFRPCLQRNARESLEIPPTAVGGSFKSRLRPSAAVNSFQILPPEGRYLNDPPTAVGGIWDAHATS